MSALAPMLVLALDTCGLSGSITLGRVDSGTVDVLAQTALAGKTYSACLVPALRAMLQEQGIEAADLNAVVVVNGPGSFTGVRIGVSSAKGLADALDIPLLAVSRLAVLARKAQSRCAALDAGRGEFYLRSGDQEYLIGAKDLPYLSTDAIAVCEASAQRMFTTAVLVEPPAALDALHSALPRLLARDYSDPRTLDGNYVRRSDAEIFAKAVGKA